MSTISLFQRCTARFCIRMATKNQPCQSTLSLFQRYTAGFYIKMATKKPRCQLFRCFNAALHDSASGWPRKSRHVNAYAVSTLHCTILHQDGHEKAAMSVNPDMYVMNQHYTILHQDGHEKAAMLVNTFSVSTLHCTILHQDGHEETIPDNLSLSAPVT